MKIFELFLAEEQNQKGKSIKIVKSDRGEATLVLFKKFDAHEGIRNEYMIRCTP